ncbi:hypothetical protein FRC14_006492 [Serendipita sp. 396]|nr:hypothetical protein FRC14_006492 [Serendipita sp. 396]KAG8778928.1 hypothetical protein FRC15_010460 [Serendipita sp. 397]KAG8795998.1 hypothetical protein FRC16_009857 [Serendipita sp. 398]KAG8819186.1 hypothetical protein FRC19_010041 [Serendipita sp. 401]KAG8826928.1 hypothetical protein FRC18_009950 [Serendipita sp. 400]KAG8849230.1 hypothetical protein FRB91_010145 [Serendipita sp. 411]KAG8864366.1 hypothetical protein FRC20_010304 [Serendipita sp. 405]KAG9031087.1 hypothetical prot
MSDRLTIRDLIRRVDSDDDAAAFIKEYATKDANGLSSIPADIFDVKVSGSDIRIVYGRKYPHKNKKAGNLAQFSFYLRIGEFASRFNPFTQDPKQDLEIPVNVNKLGVLKTTIGAGSIDVKDTNIQYILQDQLFAISMITDMLSSIHGNQKPLSRQLLYRERGVDTEQKDYFIVQMPPLMINRNTSSLSNSESPRKRGERAPAPKPVVVVLDEIPTKASAPGTLYPPGAVPWYDAANFTGDITQLRVKQPSIFYKNGLAVLPAHLPNVLTPGTIVKIVLTFGAWVTLHKISPNIKLQSLTILGELDEENPSEDDGSDNDTHTRLDNENDSNQDGAEDNSNSASAPDVKSNTTSDKPKDAEDAVPQSLREGETAHKPSGSNAHITELYSDDEILKIHPDTAPSRKRSNKAPTDATASKKKRTRR